MIIYFLLKRDMSIYGHIRPSAAHSDQFLRMESELATYVFRWQRFAVIAYMASNSPVCPLLVNGDHVCSRIWSMNDLVHIEAEVRYLGLRYQVIADMALWGKIEQIWPKVAYNGPIYVRVARYVKFWPYECLHYQFWSISTLSCRFDHIAIKMPCKCKLARNGPQWYYMSCYNEVCPFMAIFDTA